MNRIGVLLMAYGSPDTLADVEPYYTDIRSGRPPSREALNELVERYRRIGGRTPLLDITRSQAQALQSVSGPDYSVYVGMKHWQPRIDDAVAALARDGVTRLIAMTLAPHYSRLNTEGYFQRVKDALAALPTPPEVRFVESWNDHPLFLQSIAERLEQGRADFGASSWAELSVLFTAHSLPARILDSNDPYPRELQETCEGAASLVGLTQWRFAYQSAGRTGEPWLGPEFLDSLEAMAGEGCRRVLVAPVGFVADHLEVLYDIDVEAAGRARELGIELRRIASPNATPTFIAALQAIVREHAAGWTAG